MVLCMNMSSDMYLFDRKNAGAHEVPPLLAVTAEQTQNIVTQRAEEMLRHSEVDEDDCEISCTPAFQESELGGSELPPQNRATVDGDGDSDEPVLLEEEDKGPLELEDVHVVPVKGGTNQPDACSPSSSVNKVHNLDSETDSVVTTEVQAASGAELLLVSDEKHSDSCTHLATSEHTVSFCDDLREVDYPTLWQLSTEESERIDHFYVPALVSVIFPLKVHIHIHCHTQATRSFQCCMQEWPGHVHVHVHVCTCIRMYMYIDNHTAPLPNVLKFILCDLSSLVPSM